MWKGAENWDGKNVNEYGWLLVMDKGSWSKQNLGLGTAHRVSLHRMCILGLPPILETSLESNSNTEHRR